MRLLFILICIAISCKPNNSIPKDRLSAPTYADNGINMVIEIPAGTSHKIEINKHSGSFENDKIDGKDRIIDFLPYPGNYGFIPSTLMEISRGGDGDALDVLMIGESIPTGTLVAIQPIGTLLLKDNGALDTKLIAVPADDSKAIIDAKNFLEFSVRYPAAKKIIEDWFLNYKGLNEMELIGWRDERHALEEIKKWVLP